MKISTYLPIVFFCITPLLFSSFLVYRAYLHQNNSIDILAASLYGITCGMIIDGAIILIISYLIYLKKGK